MTPVAMQFGGSSGNRSITGAVFDKLWENPDPSATFAAQTVSLDLQGYDAIYIVFLGSGGNPVWSGIVLADGASFYARFVTNTGANTRWFGRVIKVTSTGVEFAAASRFTQGTSGTTTDNDAMKPSVIYGIKF